jgi:hypothetical protein
MDATEMTFTTDGFRLGTDAQRCSLRRLSCVRGRMCAVLGDSVDVAADGGCSVWRLAGRARDRRSRHVCRDGSLAATGDVVFSSSGNQVVTVKGDRVAIVGVSSRGPPRTRSGQHEYSDSGGQLHEIAVLITKT